MLENAFLNKKLLTDPSYHLDGNLLSNSPLSHCNETMWHNYASRTKTTIIIEPNRISMKDQIQSTTIHQTSTVIY